MWLFRTLTSVFPRHRFTQSQTPTEFPTELSYLGRVGRLEDRAANARLVVPNTARAFERKTRARGHTYRLSAEDSRDRPRTSLTPTLRNPTGNSPDCAGAVQLVFGCGRPDLAVAHRKEVGRVARGLRVGAGCVAMKRANFF